MLARPAADAPATPMRALPAAILAAVVLVLVGAASGASAAPGDAVTARAAPKGSLQVFVTDLPASLRPRVRVIGAGRPRPVTGAGRTLSLAPGTYTLVARPVRAGRATFYPRRARSRLRVRPGATAVGVADYGILIPRSTRPFTRAMARRLVTATPGELVFAGAEPIGLRRGQVVVGGPARRLPDGVLRRVVSVAAEGGRTVVRTAPARLIDALPAGSLDAVARVGRSTRAGGRRTAGTEVPLPSVTIKLDRMLFTRGLERGGCKVGRDSSLTGELTVAPVVRISSRWRIFPIPRPTRVSFSATLDQHASLTLAAGLKGSCKADYDTPDVRAGAFAVQVGPITLPVVVLIDARVALEAAGEVAADGELRQDLVVTGGLAISGKGVKSLNRFALGFGFDRPSIETVKGTASIRVGPRVKLTVAGAAGPYLNVNAEADLAVEPGGDPLWELTGGLNLRGGIKLLGLERDAEILSYRLPTPIRTQRGGGFVQTPPELAAPPPTLRGLGRVFPRPDLTEAPVDTVPTPIPVTIVCTVQGPPVAGVTGISTAWFGLDDGTFVNAVDVAGAPRGGLPGCVVPPPRRGPPTPVPKPPPPKPTIPDRDRDRVPDASDACPDTPGVAPRGCPRVRGLALGPDGGYWLAAEDGGVFSFGAPFHGSLGATPFTRPAVGIAPNPATRGGYWLAAGDGGVFAFDTPFLGSVATARLSAPIVGIAARPQGDGYWLTGTDGGVFAFGAAPFLGSLPGLGVTPNAPIVGIAATPSGNGYWLAGADGGVFAFGDAPYLGGLVGTTLSAPIVGIAATPSGQGYWLAGADGGVFANGDAGFFGSLGNGPALNQPIVGITATATGAGYWLVAGDRGVFAHGDAVYRGGTA
ncbi:MAG: hypothetical protein QOD86_2651 [Miltoncostaeaceae bacterium]|nr:hypothetical protein [Miltoncostaeaceae bacterium]